MIHENLTGAQKCAVLLLLLDELEAAELLRQMASEEVRAVGHAMLSVAEIEPRAIDTVLDEFLAASRTTAALGAGGTQVRAVFERALGPQRAGSLLGEMGPPVTPRPFTALEWVDPVAIAAMLEAEHPQAAAVVLAHLEPQRASDVLAALPEALQPDLLYRLATMGPVTAAVVAGLDRVIEAHLAVGEATNARAAAMGGASLVAKLLAIAPDQARLLAALRELDPAMTESIAESLFIFDDLLKIDARGMQALVLEVEPEQLVLALKGASEALRAHVYAAMSARAAAGVQDDLAALGPTKLAEVRTAQAGIAAVVRRLADAGALMMPGSAGGYV
jgi:flagellar motor switch protein FliG